jgi:RNase P subunit RPR2
VKDFFISIPSISDQADYNPSMETRYYHGNLTPLEIAQALVARFDHGNLHAQSYSSHDKVIVQIASRNVRASGGQTAMTVALQRIQDGVSVQAGEQELLGVAVSLGQSVLATLLNPWNVISRLDDIAQDVTSLSLADQVWEEIENVARSAGANFELSERLRRLVCSYCKTANPVGEASCIACGAPLGESQPRTCLKCGFVVKTGEGRCPQCGEPL